MTYILARSKEATDKQVLVVSCHPGWVKTDMGGDRAPLTVEEGAETPVWLAYTPASQLKNGEFYSNKAVCAW
jgi:carbonyl reductase 1